MADRSVVIDTSRSPHALLHPVAVGAVRLADTFWQPRLRINRDLTLPSQYRQCEETGRIDNFRRAAGKKQGPFQGIYFNDSDVYKWLEAVGWALASGDDPALRAMADTAITEMAAAQQPDGYLNTYFMFEHAAERWSNLKDMHELYCAGHLLQGAIAYHRATGDARLLDVARRYADYICQVFGPEEEGKRPGTCGHEEIEMAMAELARETGDAKYLRQAQYFIDVRGHGVIGGSAYVQDHKPFRDTDRMVGHAVRQVYLNCGAADVHAETGEAPLRGALDRLWANMTGRQLYVSGGIGSRYEGEAFGKDYELPNERAYTETCAAIGEVMWAWRMLALEGDARYADVMELALYNAVLPGLSLDGQAYFYQNPLSDDGTHRRQPWFGCACCPPNVARMLASLPGYVYSVSDGAIWTHLYAAGTAGITLPDGRAVQLATRTDYPWGGEIAIDVSGEGRFALNLRIPGWCETGAEAAVNGQPVGAVPPVGGYLRLEREWQPGDTVRLSLPMWVRMVEAHPYVAEDAGKVALMRGPLLYCVEQADNPGIDPRDIVVTPEASFEADSRPDLLGGVVTLRGKVEVSPPDEGWEGRLYRTAQLVPPETVSVGGQVAHRVRLTSSGREPASAPTVEVTAIPYYAWANRDPGRMEVWLKRR